MKKIQSFSVFLVGFCIPFHSVTVSMGREMSVSILSMLLYTLVLIPYVHDITKQNRYYGNYVYAPLLYCIYLFFVNILHITNYNTPVFDFTLFECFVLFALFLIHFKHNNNAPSIAMQGFAFGALTLSVLASRGIGVEIDSSMRLKIFDMNPNTVGMLLSMGIIVIINSLIVRDELHLKIFRFFFIAALIPMLATIMLTGSRTAFAITTFSLVVLLLLIPIKTKVIKIIILIMCGLGLIYAINTFMQQSDTIIVERLLKTKEAGDMSERDDMWLRLLPHIFNSPIWGYGETGYVDVSREAFGFSMVTKEQTVGFSPHNVILEILIKGGVIGLLFWLWLWKNVGIAAWRAYRIKHLLTPLIMLIPMLASIISGQFLNNSWAYLLYAYILSEGIIIKHKICRHEISKQVFEKPKTI